MFSKLFVMDKEVGPWRTNVANFVEGPFLLNVVENGESLSH